MKQTNKIQTKVCVFLQIRWICSAGTIFPRVLVIILRIIWNSSKFYFFTATGANNLFHQWICFVILCLSLFKWNLSTAVVNNGGMIYISDYEVFWISSYEGLETHCYFHNLADSDKNRHARIHVHLTYFDWLWNIQKENEKGFGCVCSYHICFISIRTYFLTELM